MSSGTKLKTAWDLPSTDAYNASSDASLFSSSLPILSHEKLNLNKSNQSGLSLDEDFPILSKLHPKGVVKDPLENIDPSMAGVFLPGDEDELLAGLMDDFDFSDLPTQLEDLDDDFFGSGGGMEIEENPVNGISRITTSDSIGLLSLPHYGIANGVGIVSGEHPFGEHPSRTLFVRNINSNVEDSELKSMFEQFGDIRTLYTACKHRGFVMISYYDIRAARSAMLGLQNKPLRRRKLDIHFSIPKYNPSEKDVNQGTLVVFNLDASVSNEELHQIFGAYGEVKEIRETPHKRHHKFIEFYDVRAAEAALKALNKCVIAGKCIKLEPSRPGGTRRSLMLQLSQEQELDEARGLRHPVGSPIGNSPPGIWPNLGSPVEQNSLNGGYSHPPNFGSNPLTGLASILPYQASSPVKITPIGKDPRLSHSNEHGGAAYQQHFSVPDQIISSSPRAASSFSDSKPSSVGTLSGPQFLWGSPTIHSDHISSSFLTSSLNPSRAERIGYPYTNQQGSFLGSRQLHVGSAPSGVQMDRHFGLFPESPESSYMNQTTYGLPNFSHSSLGVPPSSQIMSTLRNSPTYFGGNHGITDRGRGRADSGSQMDNKVQYQLDLEKIRNGEDNRTTLMIKNIPNKYTSKMLLVTIDETHKGAYDFLYLPIDFKNKCNVGYAFINMVSPFHIISFFEVFNGKKWEKFNSEKVASLAYARIQGKIALVSHFQNSSLMNEDKRCRPIVFQSEGEDYDDMASFSSSNLNIFIRQPDGSYLEDSLDSPEGDPNY